MIRDIILILIYVLAPAVVLRLCRKVVWIGKIGPVLFLYLLGILLGNFYDSPSAAGIQEAVSSATIPLAIPLLLFCCPIERSRTKGQALALLTGLMAVIIAVLSGWLIFGKNMENADKVAAMFAGVYTGGTVNLASIKAMLDVSDELFVLVNSYDIAVCFLYLTFLMTIGIRLFRKVLDTKRPEENFEGIAEEPVSAWNWKTFATVCAADVLIAGISAGLGLLCGDKWFMTVLIVALTSLGLVCSRMKSLGNKRESYDSGMYLIYIFSIVVASMADFSKINFTENLSILSYMTFVIFGSLTLQLLFSKLLKLDADTTIISSVSYICSPPFVPMIAASMGNRSVIAAGLAIGAAGYAAGTYLGLLISLIL